MPHTVRATFAVALGLISVAAMAADARAGEPRRIIRIYDTSTDDRSNRAAAMRTAAALIDDAGIAADWLDCSPGSQVPSCGAVRGPRDLVVRIAPRSVGPMHPTPDSVSTRQTSASPDVPDPDLQLGFATFDSATRRGVLATIFHDRVLAVAQRAALDYRVLLGRAMAHEIGHLLLPASGHSSAGLMRGVWTDAELTSNRPEDWSFAPAERDRLHHAAAIARLSR
jgi:hypothetical protein